MEEPYFDSTTNDYLPAFDSDDWTSYEIFNLIWRIICVIPNIIIPYIIIKNLLYNASNFYFIVFHWSCSNVVYIVCLLYLIVIPQEYITLKCLEISYFLHNIVPALFILIVTLFIYNAYIDSKKVCKFSVYSFWLSYITGIVTIVTLVYLDLTNNKIWLYLSGVTRVACFAVTIIEAVSFFGERCKNKPTIIRFVMATIYIVSVFIEWILDLLLSQNIYNVVVFESASLTFYANGMINLILLVCFDFNFRNHFKCILPMGETK